jgi:hypothetical protein
MVDVIWLVGLKDREGLLSLKLLVGKMGFGIYLAQDMLRHASRGLLRVWVDG